MNIETYYITPFDEDQSVVIYLFHVIGGKLVESLQIHSDFFRIHDCRDESDSLDSEEYDEIDANLYNQVRASVVEINTEADSMFAQLKPIPQGQPRVGACYKNAESVFTICGKRKSSESYGCLGWKKLEEGSWIGTLDIIYLAKQDWSGYEEIDSADYAQFDEFFGKWYIDLRVALWGERGRKVK